MSTELNESQKKNYIVWIEGESSYKERIHYKICGKCSAEVFAKTVNEFLAQHADKIISADPNAFYSYCWSVIIQVKQEYNTDFMNVYGLLSGEGEKVASNEKGAMIALQVPLSISLRGPYCYSQEELRAGKHRN